MVLESILTSVAYLISKCKIILLTFIEFRICPFDLCFFSRRANFVNLFVKGQNSDIYQTACKNVENSYHQCHHSMGMSCSLKRPFEYKNKGKMNTENEKTNKIKLLLRPYLVHWIQQPISNLRVQIFTNVFGNH